MARPLAQALEPIGRLETSLVLPGDQVGGRIAGFVDREHAMHLPRDPDRPDLPAPLQRQRGDNLPGGIQKQLYILFRSTGGRRSIGSVVTGAAGPQYTTTVDEDRGGLAGTDIDAEPHGVKLPRERSLSTQQRRGTKNEYEKCGRRRH